MIASWKTRLPLTGVVLLAVCGVVVCAVLLAGHVGGWDTGGTGASFILQLCGGSSAPVGICADVINSRFGSFDVYVGNRQLLFPTSFLGLFYFLTIAFLVAFAVRPPLRSRVARWSLLGLVTAGMCASVALTAVMAVVLHAWCWLCALAHGCNVGIFAGTLWLIRRAGVTPAKRAGDAGPSDRRVSSLQSRLVLCGLVGSTALSVAAWLYFDASSEARRQWRKVKGYAAMIDELRSDPAFVLREYFAAPVVDMTNGSPRADEDDGGAPFDLLLVTDLSTSACACFEDQWTQHFSDYFGDAIRVRYAHVSKDGDPTITREQLAVAAAGLQGGRDAAGRMRRLLLSNRDDAKAQDLESLARQAELDVRRFLDDLNSEAVHELASEDVELARRLGVVAGPAAFLDGRRVPDLCLKSPVFWREIARVVKDELATQSSQVAVFSTPADQ